MAPGYSGTSLPRKLGIKPCMTVALFDAPDGFESTIGELPEGATLRAWAVAWWTTRCAPSTPPGRACSSSDEKRQDEFEKVLRV
jgi:hypothetical protein